MLASALNSETAIAVSVEVVRAFVRLRGIAVQHADLARKLEIMWPGSGFPARGYLEDKVPIIVAWYVVPAAREHIHW